MNDAALVRSRTRRAPESAAAGGAKQVLLDGLPGMAYRCRADGTLLFASAGAETLTGQPAEALLGTSLERLVHEHDRERVGGERQAALASSGAYRLTYRLVSAGCETRRVSDQGRATRDSDDDAIVLEGYLADISDVAQPLTGTAERIARLGSWSLDACSGRLTWSEGTLRIFGLAAEGFTNTSEEFLERVHPADRERLREAQRRAVDEQVPLDIEYRIRRPDGAERILYERAEIGLDAQGSPLCLAGVVMDVTEERQAQAALRASEELLRRVVAESPFPIMLHGEDGKVVELSKSWCELSGYPAEALQTTADWAALAYGERRDAIRRHLDSLYALDHRYDEGEFTIRTSDGSERTWEFNSTPAGRLPDGRRLIVSMAVDVTDRNRLAAQLAEGEERLRYVAQATVGAVWDWNLVTDAVWWNEGFAALFGYCREAAAWTGEAWADCLHPDEREEVLASLQRAIAGSSNEWEGRYRFRREDGSYAHVVDRGFVIRDASGKAVRMVGGMTDITEHVTLEERLRQSQRLEAVGQLTGGLAHDFNNLLTVVLGNTELLTEQLAGEPRLRALAEMAQSAARRGAELTQRLLAFARRQALEPRAVDVNVLLHGMDALLKRALGEHIEIELALEQGLAPALVDPGQLESALLNLCLNARDAMPGGGRLTIGTGEVTLDRSCAGGRPDVEPGRYVLISVSDTGEGIPPEHLGLVFEPFFTTKEKSKGTGLGLSMVYGFAKQSHGHVGIYSEPGQGTTVKMYLPRCGGRSPESAETDLEHGGHEGTETVLLVEDDVLVRRYVEAQLRGLGYRVLAAGSGPEALEVLRERGDIDLLFTDVVMPGGMSGRELAEAARALRPALKVLYTSGYTEDALVHHGRLDPGVHLLVKPYRRADLALRVREALAQERERT